MALLDATLNIGVQAMVDVMTHLSIHTADPGATPGIAGFTGARDQAQDAQTHHRRLHALYLELSG